MTADKTADAKQPTDDELWEQVGKDRAATPAEEVVVPDETDTAADPMAGLPEPTRKLIEGLQAKTTEQETRLHKVGQQLATAHGTMGSMKQQLDASRVALEKIAPTIASVEATNKAEADAKAAAKATRIKEAREKLNELPEIADYLDLVLPADAKPAMTEKPAEVKAEKPEKIEPESLDPDERRVLILQRELSDKVPGWIKKRDSAEFKAWLPKQNADIHARSNSWDVDEAASVFEAFEKHQSDAATVADVERQRQERLRRGEGVQGRGSSTGDVDTGPDALWNKVKRDRAREKAQVA